MLARCCQAARRARTAHASRMSVILPALTCFVMASPVLAVETPRRVFLLEGLTAVEESAQRTAEAIRLRLKERSSDDIEIYSDFLDLGRFQGPANEDRLVQFLGAKFAQVKPDIVISISRSAVDFVVRRRGDFARGVPVVYCCANPAMGDAEYIPSDMPGVVTTYDWAGTLALAQRLQPSAKTVVVIQGASDSESAVRRDLRTDGRALPPLLQQYETKYLIGLPYDELLRQVSRLPRDSIVLLRRVFEDGSGRARGPELAVDVSRASTAPVYSPSATYIGLGVVGGRMDSFGEQGAKVADLALDVLSGKDPSTLPHQIKLPLQYRVDARQLKRWGFAETSLPSGTSVEFRLPTLWEQYRKTVILALLTLAVLVGFIGLLLYEILKRQEAEKGRRTAEAETELRRKEVTHLVRVGIVSELSGGIAHELGQPLASILANAQAAQRLVGTNSPDKKEVGEILEDIVEENTRAAEVIDRLRGLLKNGEHETVLVDLNDKLRTTLRLVHSELVSRRIKVQTDLESHLPSVSGDRVQLQQVPLNLIMNAMDAMASTPSSQRTLSIRTRSTQNGHVEVSITDCGPGISPDHLRRIFEPYFTTKEHGLGLGLSICSTIVRSHHGQLNIANTDSGGVTAAVSLPAAIRLAAAS